MADRLTIARPYAKAAFAEAKADGNLAIWSTALERGALTVADARVRALFGSPRVSATQLGQFVADIADGGGFGARGRNFIALLAENKRLPFLAEISQIFNALKDDAERVVDVHITAAAALPQAEGAQLTAALEKRFNRKVRVQSDVDPSLIGGAVVRAGDLTIDGSVKARLARLARELTA
jgi:F-type H+-transporting ATPase subunit delta